MWVNLQAACVKSLQYNGIPWFKKKKNKNLIFCWLSGNSFFHKSGKGVTSKSTSHWAKTVKCAKQINFIRISRRELHKHVIHFLPRFYFKYMNCVFFSILKSFAAQKKLMSAEVDLYFINFRNAKRDEFIK